MQAASTLRGVSVVTLSYALPESFLAEVGVNEQSYDAGFTTPGVTFLAASGDEGIYGDGGEQVAVNYPSASPNVVSVGGTSIVIDSNGDYPGTGTSGETAWGDGPDVRTINGIEGSGVDGGGGGGLSDVETEPAYQSGVVPTSVDPDRARALPDVSMDSGSTQAYDVFTNTLGASSDSDNAVGWLGDAGTSAASPIWAGLIAIADQGRVLEGGTPLTGYSQTLPALYSLPSTDFHDITNGNNGDPAEPGYDLATGLGTPVANLLVPALAGYEISSQISIKTEPPSTIAAGNSFTVAVQVTDSVGNPVSSGSVTVNLGPNPVGDAVLDGTPTEPVQNGVATFDLSLSQAGTYTLTVTDSTIPGSLTTSSITVTTATSYATNIDVKANPAAPVVGQPVTLTATVSVQSPGTGVPMGTVTFEEGSTILGMPELTSGVAQVTFTPSTAATKTISVSFSGDSSDQADTVNFSLTVGKGTATLNLSDLNDTYDGSPRAAAVTTSPPGLSGASITYSQNGMPVTSPTHAGDYTVTATLDNANYAAAARHRHTGHRPGDPGDYLGRSREHPRRHGTDLCPARCSRDFRRRGSTGGVELFTRDRNGSSPGQQPNAFSKLRTDRQHRLHECWFVGQDQRGTAVGADYQRGACFPAQARQAGADRVHARIQHSAERGSRDGCEQLPARHAFHQDHQEETRTAPRSRSRTSTSHTRLRPIR